ncbi:hypothetical protein BB559_001427 [Furculomyces boomerangus]|uniref:tRNA(Ile)-lysidine/2-thiocytidine synthase N-terminal domain-containing protein n=2 Tax=Harpellales TaxID=61421 RepID=A0A2T9Z221_9FUNG|nr:hypothetical protein BB559_001427 [Furculomyces boomerangus]PWA03619.1 hypothetical protein BB558_000264 [Smittium angustum]
MDLVSKFNKIVTRNDAPGLKYVLAVSGGVDSMSLAYLSKNSSISQRFQTLVVDHGLREESSNEAQIVVENLSKIGIRAYIRKIKWADSRITTKINISKPMPGPKLEEHARIMRNGIRHIMSNAKLVEKQHDSNSSSLESIQAFLPSKILPLISSAQYHAFFAKQLVSEILDQIATTHPLTNECTWSIPINSPIANTLAQRQSILHLSIAKTIEWVACPQHPPTLNHIKTLSNEIVSKLNPNFHQNINALNHKRYCIAGIVLLTRLEITYTGTYSLIATFSKDLKSINNLYEQSMVLDQPLDTDLVWNDTTFITINKNIPVTPAFSSNPSQQQLSTTEDIYPDLYCSVISLSHFMSLHRAGKFQFPIDNQQPKTQICNMNKYFDFEIPTGQQLSIKEAIIYMKKVFLLERYSKNVYVPFATNNSSILMFPVVLVYKIHNTQTRNEKNTHSLIKRHLVSVHIPNIDICFGINVANVITKRKKKMLTYF